ncbi:unnamed protein product [Amoebophrya sp. A25]|nr:unnamed protein product [Amoebophrya sp. A25]|eukprot:GSA25T00000851001.1
MSSAVASIPRPMMLTAAITNTRGRSATNKGQHGSPFWSERLQEYVFSSDVESLSSDNGESSSSSIEMNYNSTSNVHHGGKKQLQVFTNDSAKNVNLGVLGERLFRDAMSGWDEDHQLEVDDRKQEYSYFRDTTSATGRGESSSSASSSVDIEDVFSYAKDRSCIVVGTPSRAEGSGSGKGARSNSGSASASYRSSSGGYGPPLQQGATHLLNRSAPSWSNGGSRALVRAHEKDSRTHLPFGGKVDDRSLLLMNVEGFHQARAVREITPVMAAPVSRRTRQSWNDRNYGETAASLSAVQDDLQLVDVRAEKAEQETALSPAEELTTEVQTRQTRDSSSRSDEMATLLEDGKNYTGKPSRDNKSLRFEFEPDQREFSSGQFVHDNDAQEGARLASTYSATSSGGGYLRGEGEAAPPETSALSSVAEQPDPSQILESYFSSYGSSTSTTTSPYGASDHTTPYGGSTYGYGPYGDSSAVTDAAEVLTQNYDESEHLHHHHHHDGHQGHHHHHHHFGEDPSSHHHRYHHHHHHHYSDGRPRFEHKYEDNMRRLIARCPRLLPDEDIAFPEGLDKPVVEKPDLKPNPKLFRKPEFKDQYGDEITISPIALHTGVAPRLGSQRNMGLPTASFNIGPPSDDEGEDEDAKRARKKYWKGVLLPEKCFDPLPAKVGFASLVGVPDIRDPLFTSPKLDTSSIARVRALPIVGPPSLQRLKGEAKKLTRKLSKHDLGQPLHKPQHHHIKHHHVGSSSGHQNPTHHQQHHQQDKHQHQKHVQHHDGDKHLHHQKGQKSTDSDTPSKNGVTKTNVLVGNGIQPDSINRNVLVVGQQAPHHADLQLHIKDENHVDQKLWEGTNSELKPRGKALSRAKTSSALDDRRSRQSSADDIKEDSREMKSKKEMRRMRTSLELDSRDGSLSREKRSSKNSKGDFSS